MGFDLDTLLSYKTPKFVAIRDCKLGLLQKLLMVLIMIKIAVMTIYVNCLHLKPDILHGTSIANVRKPMDKSCDGYPLNLNCPADFSPMSVLPYCTQYSGKAEEKERRLWAGGITLGKEIRRKLKGDSDEGSGESEGSGEGSGEDSEKSDSKGSSEDKASSEKEEEKSSGGDKKEEKKSSEGDKKEEKKPKMMQLPCAVWDGIHMERTSPHPGMVFVPTRHSVAIQQQGCKPSKGNGWSCEPSPYLAADKDSDSEAFFISDVEAFTILVDSVFTDKEGRSGSAGDYQGYIRPSDSKINLEPTANMSYGTKLVKHKEAYEAFPIPAKPDTKSDFPSLQMTPKGDIISLGGLMKAIDPRGVGILDVPREDGTSLRYNGGVIHVSVFFDNKKKMDPLGQAPPEYIYDVGVLPMDEYKVVFDRTKEDGSREVRTLHGILIIFGVSGYMRTFDVTYLLQVMTTAMVSLALANTLTDALMLYTMPRSVKYQLLKYQESEDFSDFDKSVSSVKDRKKTGYDRLQDKPSPHAQLLHDAVRGRDECPAGKELLAILVKFEQRLNRLDALDAFNIGDKTDEASDKWMHEREEKFRSTGELKLIGTSG